MVQCEGYIHSTTKERCSNPADCIIEVSTPPITPKPSCYECFRVAKLAYSDNLKVVELL